MQVPLGDTPEKRIMRAPSPISTPSQASFALASLCAYIQEHELTPGMKLPSERELAGILTVGRPALREAIKALTVLDVLMSKRGAGTYLKTLAALKTDLPGTIEVVETEINMLELLEFRKILEPRAAMLAASRATMNDLRAMERTRVAIEQAGFDWSSVAELDFSLHRLIISAAKNATLLDVYNFLTPMLLKSREITARTAADWSRMHADHQRIVEAIARGETEKAESAMTEHLHHVGFDLIANRKR